MGTANKPSIVIDGTEIAHYVYGYSGRVAFPKRSATGEDLRHIYNQVRRGQYMYDVELRPIKHTGEVTIGSKVLMLSIDSGVIRKTLYEITNIVPNSEGNDKVIQTRTILPEAHEDFEGFFQARHFEEIRTSKYPDVLYLAYYGPVNRPEKKSFYDQMLEKASELKVLIECWVMVLCSQEVSEDAIGFDSYEGAWRTGFRKAHGNELQHELVCDILYHVLLYGELRGINRIFNDQRWPKVDLVNPLMAQMQEDILTMLLGDQRLAEKIFSGGKYWRKKIKVIFEQYYGSKEMTVSDLPRVEPIKKISGRTADKLRLIESLIRGAKTEGERDAAICAWERVSGETYDYRPDGYEFMLRVRLAEAETIRRNRRR